MVRQRRANNGWVLAAGLILPASLSTCELHVPPERERELYSRLEHKADEEGNRNGRASLHEIREYCRSRGFEPYFGESKGPARDKFYARLSDLYRSGNDDENK